MVEVYSSLSESHTNGFINGYWTRTKSISKNVSHVQSVVMADEQLNEHGMLIGGDSKNEPQNYIQIVPTSCNQPEHPIKKGTSMGGTRLAQCDTKNCSDGYIETTKGGVTTCLMCPGVTTTGTCTSACSGSFGGSGTCQMPNKTSSKMNHLLASLIESPTLPICKCAPFYGGLKCDQCINHRSGIGCTKCLKGRQGPVCKACPGFDLPLGVCGGNGECRGDGTTTPLSDGGTCDCDNGWDSGSNCTKCSKNFYPYEDTCKICKRICYCSFICYYYCFYYLLNISFSLFVCLSTERYM